MGVDLAERLDCKVSPRAIQDRVTRVCGQEKGQVQCQITVGVVCVCVRDVYVCICVFVCIMCVYAPAYVRMHVCVRAVVYVCVYVCMRALL